MRGFHLHHSLALFAVLGLAGVPAVFGDVFSMSGAQKSLLFVPVGDIGNDADTTGFGQVNYNYQMGMYDVTAAQYCAFLNAVAKTDPYGVWNADMGTAFGGITLGQITRTGDSGSYEYTVRSGHENKPMNNISWGSAARFANWLSNGQPTTGVENAMTTERGSYALDGAITDSALHAVTRSANATYVIPTRDEWYKAAYYKGGSDGGYWEYPTRSDTMPSNELNADGLNNANFWDYGFTDPVNNFTDVGYFKNCASPYGAFDMGELIWQWTETPFGINRRAVQGGSFAPWGGGTPGGFMMAASNQDDFWFFDAYYDGSTGFRVAAVPEPAALSCLAIGSLGLLARRRFRRAG